MWGSEFTTKAAALQFYSAGFVTSHFSVGLGPVVASARVSVHEFTRAEDFADRQFQDTALTTPYSRSKDTARETHVDAVDLRVVVDAILAVAANAVLVAHHFP